MHLNFFISKILLNFLKEIYLIFNCSHIISQNNMKPFQFTPIHQGLSNSTKSTIHDIVDENIMNDVCASWPPLKFGITKFVLFGFSHKKKRELATPRPKSSPRTAFDM
jgi:hypothetical protein